MRSGSVRRTATVVAVALALALAAVAVVGAAPGPDGRRPDEIGERVARPDEVFGGGPVAYQVPLYGSYPEDPSRFVMVGARLATLDEIEAHLGREPTDAELAGWRVAVRREQQAMEGSLDSLAGLGAVPP